jgi:hypothetical protein
MFKKIIASLNVMIQKIKESIEIVPLYPIATGILDLYSTWRLLYPRARNPVLTGDETAWAPQPVSKSLFRKSKLTS